MDKKSVYFSFDKTEMLILCETSGVNRDLGSVQRLNLLEKITEGCIYCYKFFMFWFEAWKIITFRDKSDTKLLFSWKRNFWEIFQNIFSYRTSPSPASWYTRWI